MDSAVIVVDMQNAFCHAKGSIAGLGAVPSLPAAIAAQQTLLAAARSAGVPVTYIRHVYRPGLVDMPERAAKLWPTVPEPVVRGSWDADIAVWDADIIDELTPTRGDLVIDKNRYDAFLYTDLEATLRGLGARRLLFTGVLTNVCVECSVRSAEQRGFDPYVASDCTAAYGDFKESALAAMSGIFATIEPSATLMGKLFQTTV